MTDRENRPDMPDHRRYQQGAYPLLDDFSYLPPAH